MNMLKEVSIGELHMWYDNARYEYELADEKECITTLFESIPGKTKMLNLLAEIIRVGFIRETLIIFDDEEKGKVVLDGNRRISLLRIHKYPDLIEKYNISLSLLDKIADIQFINCQIYPNLEEAYDHVESRHQGEQEGRGTVNWNAGGKQRMKEIRGQEPSTGYKIQQFFKNTPLPQYTFVKENIKNISTIERILFKKCIYKDKFGLNNKNEYDLENKKIVDKLNELFTMFYKYDPSGKVKHVFYAEDIQKFFSDLEPINNIPNTQIALDLTSGKTDWPIETPNPKPVTATSESGPTTTNTTQNGSTTSVEQPKNYNSYQSNPIQLFNWTSKGLSIGNKPLNHYVKELNQNYLTSRSLGLNKFIYQAAPLYYRVILECAIREFNNFINNDRNKYKFNGITPQELAIFNTTNKNVSLISEKKLCGIYTISKKIKDQRKKEQITILIKRLNKLDMNTEEKYRLFVYDLNEVVHGSVITFDDEKLSRYDDISLINLQLISIMMN